jgi:FKBP-type peptidyl-prolyl cis-trans isomerase
MARMRERIFAGAGAILFFGSACAVTFFALTQGSGDKTATTQTSQNCTDTQTEPTLDVPKAYTTADRVTELQKTDLSAGSGRAAKANDCVVVKYYGTLAKDGSKFDENFTDATGFPFKLGTGAVITGWDEGLVGMKIGGTRRLVIPAEKAYGAAGSCRTYDQTDQSKCTNYVIPPDSDLVFTVKLLRIQ